MDKKNITQFYKEASKIHLIYLRKSKEIINYNIYNIYTNIIIENLSITQIKKSLNKASKNGYNATYERFQDAKNENTQNSNYETINTELIYKLHFQAFEEFLAELLYFCFKEFPKFMNSVDSKNDIPFDKIFNTGSSIDDIKDFMITFRVKKIIQSNNIVETINKIERAFKFQFNLSEKQLNDLYIASLNRNLLTHNNGIVNEVYLHQLKIRKLNSNLKKGDSIFELIKQNDINDSSNMINISETLMDIIQKDEIRLTKYHESLL